MTDINDLDRHIGRYVDLQNGKDGAAGFLVDVADEVTYQPEPTRVISFDWGQSWPVTEDTVMTFPESPEGEGAPQFSNPVRVMHLAMHNGATCPDLESCAYEKQSVRAIQAFRSWRMKQTDAYWEHQYVEKVRSYVEVDDPCGASYFIREALHEGAPPHVMDRMSDIASRGEPGGWEDFDPFANDPSVRGTGS